MFVPCKILTPNACMIYIKSYNVIVLVIKNSSVVIVNCYTLVAMNVFNSSVTDITN